MSILAGHEIAPNTGAIVPKFPALATNFQDLVTRTLHHTLPEDLVNF